MAEFEQGSGSIPVSECSANDFPDSLRSYLQQIGHFAPLAPEDQNALCAEISRHEGELRTHLLRFGFVATEFLRIIEACLAGTGDPSDYFIPSSLPGEEESDGFFRSWRDEILVQSDALQRGFSRRRPVEKERLRLAETLDRANLNPLRCEEFHNLILNYLFPESSGPRDLKKLDPDAFTPDYRQMLEERFLLNWSEMTAELHAIAEIQTVLFSCRNRMLEANLRLVICVAQRYRNRGIPFSDLIQEGNLGLVRALKCFDVRLGNKFSTYASWWIKHYLLRAVAEQSRVIRIPAHMMRLINAINRAEQRFVQKYGREPGSDELAQLLKLPEPRINSIRKMAQQTLSLQAPVSCDEDSSMLEELIADEKADDPAHETAKKMLYDKLYEMLRLLPERDQQIIIMRFGLFGQPCMPLADISARFKLTRERVRQLEVKILRDLRTPEMLKHIDGKSGAEIL